MTAAVSMQEVLDAFMEERLSELFTSLPGIVQSYNASAQTAVIRPALKAIVPGRRDDDVDEEYEDLPFLQDVPVIWPRGSSASLTLPLGAGDTVLIVGLQMDPSAWRRTGSVSVPDDSALHHITHCVAIPGFNPSTATIPGASASTARFAMDSGPYVELTALALHLYGTGEAYVRGTTFASALSTALTSAQVAATARAAAWTALAALPALAPAAPALGAAATADTNLAAALGVLIGRLVPGDILSTKVFGD